MKSKVQTGLLKVRLGLIEGKGQGAVGFRVYCYSIGVMVNG